MRSYKFWSDTNFRLALDDLLNLEKSFEVDHAGLTISVRDGDADTDDLARSLGADVM